jgi:lipoyl-dependent peroxiredoxin
MEKTSDGNLKVSFALPEEMGGAGKPGTTNPEQLFALGYASCFGQALKVVTGKEQIKVNEVKVTSHVTMGKTDAGGFGLSAALHIQLPGVDRSKPNRWLPPRISFARIPMPHGAIST